MRDLIRVTFATVLIAGCAVQPGTSGSPPVSASPSPSPSMSPSPSPDTTAVNAAIDSYRSDIETYWTVDFPTVYGAPYKPITGFVAYHNVRDAPTCDGYRLRLGNAYYCEQGDYIAWDEPGLMLPLYEKAGSFAVAFVLAHEWGHAVAARAGANLPISVIGELQADCFAGTYGAWAEQHGTLRASDLDGAVFAMYDTRDPAGTPWLDPSAHGTAYERIGAFSEGYRQGPALCQNYALPSPPFPPPGSESMAPPVP